MCEDCACFSKYALCGLSFGLAMLCWMVVNFVFWFLTKAPKIELLPRSYHYPRWAIIVGLGYFMVFIIACIAPLIKSKILLKAVMLVLMALIFIEFVLIMILLVKSIDSEDHRFGFNHALRTEQKKNPISFYVMELKLQCCGLHGPGSYWFLDQLPDSCCLVPKCDTEWITEWVNITCMQPPCRTPHTAFDGCDKVVFPVFCQYMRYAALALFILIVVQTLMIIFIWRQLVHSFYLWTIP